MLLFEPENNRAVIIENGEELGFCEYEDRGNAWVITKTYIAPEIRGYGFGKLVIECVIKNAENQNITIIPECSAAKAYIEKRNEE